MCIGTGMGAAALIER